VQRQVETDPLHLGHPFRLPLVATHEHDPRPLPAIARRVRFVQLVEKARDRDGGKRFVGQLGDSHAQVDELAVSLVAAIAHRKRIAGQAALEAQPPLAHAPAVLPRFCLGLDLVAGGVGAGHGGVEVRADAVLPLAGHVLEGVERVPEREWRVPRLRHQITRSSLVSVGHQNFSMYPTISRVPSSWET
jgi:hypothetical protein